MDRRTHCAGEWILALLLCAVDAWAQAQSKEDPHRFDDSEVADIDHPAWFKQSFLGLREDLVEAEKAKKLGILLFFSSRSCSYCKAFLNSTLAESDIRDGVQSKFDVIGLDIFSGLDVIDVTGQRLPIKDFAVREGARFTPTLIFYDTAGARMLRIVGYYPPEAFRVALAYLTGGHYQQEPLRAFLSRYQAFGPETGSIDRDKELFSRPPHIFDRRAAPSPRPLLVLFERPGCEPCARLHRNVLRDGSVRSLIKQ
jgi:thioredoxin-related protein